MTVYWITYSFLVFLAFTSKTRKQKPNGFFRKNFNLLTLYFFFFFVLFIGFRFDVGGDWNQYLVMYLRVNDFSSSGFILGDPAFNFLNLISSQLGIGFHGSNIICAGIFMYGLLKFCRYLPRPNLALLVAFPYLIIIVGMGYQRQSVAIGLSMLATLALFERRI